MPGINCIRPCAPAGDLRGCAVPGLDGDDGVHQVGVDAVPPGGVVDDVGERPRGGLGQGFEEAGAYDDQQEHEATAAETRRRHGRARTIPHRRPYASLDWRHGWAIRSRLEPVKKVARMIKRHSDGMIDAVLTNDPVDQAAGLRVPQPRAVPQRPSTSIWEGSTSIGLAARTKS